MSLSVSHNQAAQGQPRKLAIFDFHGTLHQKADAGKPAYIDTLIVAYANKLKAEGHDVVIASGDKQNIAKDVASLPDWLTLHKDLRDNIVDKKDLDKDLKDGKAVIALLVDDQPTPVMEVLTTIHGGRYCDPADLQFRKEIQAYVGGGPAPGAMKP